MAKKNQESPYPPQVNYDQFAFEIGRKEQRIKPIDIFSNAPPQWRTFFSEGENPMPEAGAIYGHFKNRNKNVNGCIIHNFRFSDSNPLFLKEAPRELAITESTGAFLVTDARETTHEPNPVMAFKFNRSVKIKTNSFQYGALIFSKDKPTNALKVSLACLAQSSLFLRITNKTKSLETFVAWFYRWWDWHVLQMAQINLQRKNDLLEKAHQGDTYIDPWINQADVLRELTKKDFPKLFSTWKEYKTAVTENQKQAVKDKARFAFIAEWKRVTGKTPTFIDDSRLATDEEAVNYLHAAQSSITGSKTNNTVWWLAINWTKCELFLKNAKGILESYQRETGNKTTEYSLRKAVERAGLRPLIRRGKKPAIKNNK